MIICINFECILFLTHHDMHNRDFLLLHSHLNIISFSYPLYNIPLHWTIFLLYNWLFQVFTVINLVNDIPFKLFLRINSLKWVLQLGRAHSFLPLDIWHYATFLTSVTVQRLHHCYLEAARVSNSHGSTISAQRWGRGCHGAVMLKLHESPACTRYETKTAPRPLFWQLIWRQNHA